LRRLSSGPEEDEEEEVDEDGEFDASSLDHWARSLEHSARSLRFPVSVSPPPSTTVACGEGEGVVVVAERAGVPEGPKLATWRASEDQEAEDEDDVEDDGVDDFVDDCVGRSVGGVCELACSSSALTHRHCASCSSDTASASLPRRCAKSPLASAMLAACMLDSAKIK
jgi:hypothetical protein